MNIIYVNPPRFISYLTLYLGPGDGYLYLYIDLDAIVNFGFLFDWILNRISFSYYPGPINQTYQKYPNWIYYNPFTI
jgi:hypothetical protein